MRATIVLRNSAIVAFIASPLAITILSANAALTGLHNSRIPFVCWALISFAAGIAVLNLYLAFVRPFLYSRRNANSLGCYRHVSGVPLVGSVLTTIAVLWAWGDLSVAVASLLILMIDTGGVVWLLASLRRDRSFWRVGE